MKWPLLIILTVFGSFAIYALSSQEAAMPATTAHEEQFVVSEGKSNAELTFQVERPTEKPQEIVVEGVDTVVSPSHECNEEALRIRMSELEGQVAAFEARVKELEDKNLLLMYPENTPYGAFLRSREADLLSTPEERAVVKQLLGDFTIMLRPDQVYWVYSQCQDGVWQGWSYDYYLARARMLESLGHNLAVELPLDDATYLADYRAEG
jgi:hypothetical protein